MKKILFIVLLFPMVAFSFEGDFFAFNQKRTIKETSKICNDLSNVFCVTDAYFVFYLKEKNKIIRQLYAEYQKKELKNFKNKAIIYQVKDIETHKLKYYDKKSKKNNYKQEVKNLSTGVLVGYDISLSLEFKIITNENYNWNKVEIDPDKVVFYLKLENKKWKIIDEHFFGCYQGDGSCI
ncbi:MAG: hypothetical protein ACTSXL_05375 [Alphaproteobacteria bacterium]